MMCEIIKITKDNYELFDNMIFWRMNGYQRDSSESYVLDERISNELDNPNLHIFAIKTDDIFVGWISLIYLPKVGRFQGHGHVYVDELWVHPDYQGRGLAKALMKKADELCEELDASGVRLYVNENNPVAQGLYKKCGYECTGHAYFMEK